MNILVIGNGFDIAHELPTRYSDFLDYIRAYKNPDKRSEEKKTYFDNLKDKNITLYNEINSMSDNNCWLDYFLRIYQERCREGKDGWIDFESEISDIIQTLDSARLKLQDEFIKGAEYARIEKWQLQKLYPVFKGEKMIPSDIKYDRTAIPQKKARALSDLNRLIRCLEIYLSDYISYNKCKPLKDISDLTIHGVLSFNYTDTYKRLYDKNPDKKIAYDYIHGKADIHNNVDSCSMVLGIDEYLEGELKDKDNAFIQFKKFYQRIYKQTGCHYLDWFDRKDKIESGNLYKVNYSEYTFNIFIYGHSLDVTDADILRRLILRDDTKVTIFYHSKEALGDQIAHLVRVIGEEELIRRTDGTNCSIVFRKTSQEDV